MNLKKREFLLTAFGKRITYCTLLFRLSNKILSRRSQEKRLQKYLRHVMNTLLKTSSNIFLKYCGGLWGNV